MTDSQPSPSPIPPDRIINKKLVLIHQHEHMRGPDGIGTYRYATGMMRMIADNFAEVINLTPVRDASPEDLQVFTPYPDNIRCKVLYVRQPGQSKVRSALQYVRAIPMMVREMESADVVNIRLPSYPAVLASLVAIARRKDMLVAIGGNWGEVILARNDADRWIWRSLAGLSRWFHREISRRSVVTLVSGAHLRDISRPDAVACANHQFEDAHMFERADTCASEPLQLLYVGILSRSKGTDVLLDALRAVRAQGVKCRLVLIGSPLAGYDIDAAIAARNLDEHVELRGYVAWGPELFAAHRQSDIFVFPSLSEGVPKAPMEALSQSLPVVATYPGTSNYMVDGESGLLVPPDDADALTGAIVRMARDGELRRSCMARGYALASRHTRQQARAHINRALVAAFHDRAGR